MIGFELLLGHLVGDYLTQTDWMAVNKKKPGWQGRWPCLVHCFLYTCAVMFFISTATSVAPWKYYISWMRAFVGIFLSHYVVDRFRWLEWLHTNVYGRKRMSKDNYIREIDDRAILSIFVYAAMDNTFHLVLMYWVIQFLFYGGAI